jgi:MSHA biogenesis protein MshG
LSLYQYTGRSLTGDLVRGSLDGETPDAVASRLIAGGITPINILDAPTIAQGSSPRSIVRRLGFGKPKISDLVLFSRQMYTITKSGMPLLRGLRSLTASTHNPVMREALQDVLASLESGRDLSGSFARHPQLFPPLYLSMVRVGEATGTLEKSFQRLAEYLAQDQDLQDRVKSAMRYPLTVVIMIGVAIAILTTFVIPRFAPLFRVLGDDIPWPTRLIIGVSNFAQHRWYIVIGVIAAAVFLTRKYISTDGGRFQWHRLKLRLPGIGNLTREALLARLSRTLSVSLTAGMPMIQTLNLIAKSAGNDYMAERVVRLRAAVERGDPLSRAAASVGLFPPLVLQMMEVGEETGQLPDLLDDVAAHYAREVDYALKTLSAALEPILIVCVGGMVLVLALGVFLPMWDMIGKVSAAAG